VATRLPAESAGIVDTEFSVVEARPALIESLRNRPDDDA
jgi:hypothetical protein